MNNPGEPKSLGQTKGSSEKKRVILNVLIGLLVVLVGTLTGWLLSGNSLGKTNTGSDSESTTANITKTDDEAGIADESAFSKSEAPIGILQEGGINGEGNYHLERPGGASQNVYLTSTVLDLKSFVGKKVQVWGETLSGQKAGWLMDVGKIKVVK